MKEPNHFEDIVSKIFKRAIFKGLRRLIETNFLKIKSMKKNSS